MKLSIDWLIFDKQDYKTYRTKMLETAPFECPVFDRQSKIPGFDQEKLKAATIALIGAGGLGSEIGEGLVRKGVGKILFFDQDVVEPSNLNRQLFYKKDLYKNKAVCLAENLSKMGFGETTLTGYPYSFEEGIAKLGTIDCSIAVVGVDNDLCRVIAARYFLDKGVPVVFTGVSEDGNSSYVFIQKSKSGEPCFGCFNSKAVKEVNDGIRRFPCPGTPAIKDILKTVAGLVIFAVDTLLMDRYSEWNNRVVYLDGSVPSGSSMLKRKENCPLCGVLK